MKIIINKYFYSNFTYTTIHTELFIDNKVIQNELHQAHDNNNNNNNNSRGDARLFFWGRPTICRAPPTLKNSLIFEISLN